MCPRSQTQPTDRLSPAPRPRVSILLPARTAVDTLISCLARSLCQDGGSSTRKRNWLDFEAENQNRRTEMRVSGVRSVQGDHEKNDTAKGARKCEEALVRSISMHERHERRKLNTWRSC